MEAEVPQQPGTVKNNSKYKSKSDAEANKRRRRSDDDVITSFRVYV
jgi:hypothetical protein